MLSTLQLGKWRQVANTIRHVGVVVEDLTGAVGFWQDIFQFQIVARGIETNPFIGCVLNLTGVRLETIKMEDERGAVLELLKFHWPKPSVTNRSLTAFGITHLALNVLDVVATVDRLSKLGFNSLSSPLLSPSRRHKVAFVCGPEGLMLELVETVGS